MAQLNPNFEIDFNDINSYEQIQLINDTQLAKENLLMHKAYKEPAEDEIIRNQFSSFTFVDFCPKLFNASPGNLTAADSSRSSSSMGMRHHQYLLETFSDLFDRINLWLKSNRDWRVISMETLIFDCATQFNHLKSSIHSANLPRNMRGLRLYLSPAKSRFSGPQKIGCINVIPRKVSGQTTGGCGNELIEYETLDQILARLNELLLTRPIEGRILSVETITLPIVNGYVNTETNYFMDNRLNALSQRIFSHCNDNLDRTKPPSMFETMQHVESTKTPAASQVQVEDASEQPPHRQYVAADGDDPKQPPQMHGCGQANQHQPNGLIDTLRVYYEFGPMICGLVNLIDFLPRFNLRHPATSSTVASPVPDRDLDKANPDEDDSSLSSGPDDQQQQQPRAAPSAQPIVEQLDIDSTESLTRLVGRSLTWFDNERKRVMANSAKVASVHSVDDDHDDDHDEEQDEEGGSSASSDTETSTKSGNPQQTRGDNSRRQIVNLKVCNLQIHTKVLLKSRLAKVTPQTALEVVQSRRMFHEPPREPIVCHQCGLSSVNNEFHEWCTHLLDLNQPFELKFVRLAYVIPVCNEYATRFTRSLRSLPSLRPPKDKLEPQTGLVDLPQDSGQSTLPSQQHNRPPSRSDLDVSVTGEANRSDTNSENEPVEERDIQSPTSQMSTSGDDEEQEDDEEEEDDGDEMMSGILAAHESAEQLAKEALLAIVDETNQGHKRNEQLHQLNEEADFAEGTSASPEPNQLIGQLTYRLFAPCQLVNSSSCFSINPVNSSNPLARRGSVVSDEGSCSDATPSTLLLPSGSGGGFVGDSLSDSTLTINSNHQQQQVISFGAFFPALPHDTLLGAHNNQKHSQPHGNKGSSSHRFATTEFEPVEAIRRRMEVYVTTNSMKVLAGETLVVNLNDHLSCLSNAIEQTIVKASFDVTRQPSTWVSVYILYAAVDEPHLPSQLLEQQKFRERLQLISEVDEDEQQVVDDGGGATNQENDNYATGSGTESLGEHNMVPVFDDDFKCEQQPAKDLDVNKQLQWTNSRRQSLDTQQQSLGNTLASLNLENGSIRVELSRSLNNQTNLPPYNLAYDRTVALPTQPDDHLTNYLEPVDLNLAGSWALQQQHQQLQPGAGNVWLDENDLTEMCSYQLSDSTVRDASKLLRVRQKMQQAAEGGSSGAELHNSTSKERRRKSKGEQKRRLRTRASSEHSQCSII